MRAPSNVNSDDLCTRRGSDAGNCHVLNAVQVSVFFACPERNNKSSAMWEYSDFRCVYDQMLRNDICLWLLWRLIVIRQLPAPAVRSSPLILAAYANIPVIIYPHRQTYRQLHASHETRCQSWRQLSGLQRADPCPDLLLIYMIQLRCFHRLITNRARNNIQLCAQNVQMSRRTCGQILSCSMHHFVDLSVYSALCFYGRCWKHVGQIQYQVFSSLPPLLISPA